MLEQLQKKMISDFIEVRHTMTRDECELFLMNSFETVYACGKMDGVSELIEEDEEK